MSFKKEGKRSSLGDVTQIQYDKLSPIKNMQITGQNHYQQASFTTRKENPIHQTSNPSSKNQQFQNSTMPLIQQKELNNQISSEQEKIQEALSGGELIVDEEENSPKIGLRKINREDPPIVIGNEAETDEKTCQQEQQDFEHFQQAVMSNQRKLNETRTFFSKHHSIDSKMSPTHHSQIKVKVKLDQSFYEDAKAELTYHRCGILIYDNKANIRVIKGYPQNLEQTSIYTFYGMSIYSILDIPKPTQLNNLKKLAPDVSLETCSKHEARIYQKLPKFSSKKNVKTEYDLYVPNSDSLVLFNSRFESGNLQTAIRQTENEYILYLDSDTNSQNYSQWFYFSVMGRKKGQTIKLTIVNLLKVDSLYNKGMQVCVFSEKKHYVDKTSWHRGGYDISYKKNQTHSTYIPFKDFDMIEDSDNEQEDVEEKLRVNYSLSWKYTFEYDDDVVFFSHFYPYTHRDLKNSLAQIMVQQQTNFTSQAKSQSILRIDNLCDTLGGNPCYVLTITNNIKTYLSSEDEQQLLRKSDAARAMLKKKLDIYEARQRAKDSLVLTFGNQSQRQNPNNQDPDNGNYDQPRNAYQTGGNVLSSNDHTQMTPQMNQYLADHKKKKAIILTSRVHPGETNASYIMEGIIKFLTSNHKEAKILRSNYIFKIIPMLNPDGVIYGNYRCSLLGVDLNRRWINPSKILHPTIFYTKQIVKMMDIDRSVEMFTDIHGHSRKFNIFTYACCYNESTLEARNNAFIKIFPAILNERIESFSLKDCRFANEKEKEATARMVMFKEFSIINSYTLEASFYGTEPPEPEEESAYEEEFEEEKEEKEEKEDQLQNQKKTNNDTIQEETSSIANELNGQEIIEEQDVQNINDELAEGSISPQRGQRETMSEFPEPISPQKEDAKLEEEKEIVSENKVMPASPAPKKHSPSPKKQRQQILFNPKILNDFGMEFCRCIVLYINPVIYRRHLSHIVNLTRKKRLQNNQIVVTVKDKFGNEIQPQGFQTNSQISQSIQLNQNTTVYQGAGISGSPTLQAQQSRSNQQQSFQIQPLTVSQTQNNRKSYPSTQSPVKLRFKRNQVQNQQTSNQATNQNRIHNALSSVLNSSDVASALTSQSSVASGLIKRKYISNKLLTQKTLGLTSVIQGNNQNPNNNRKTADKVEQNKNEIISNVQKNEECGDCSPNNVKGTMLGEGMINDQDSIGMICLNEDYQTHDEINQGKEKMEITFQNPLDSGDYLEKLELHMINQSQGSLAAPHNSQLKSYTQNPVTKTKAIDLKEEKLIQQVLSTDRLPILEKNYQSINFEIRPGHRKTNVYTHQISHTNQLSQNVPQNTATLQQLLLSHQQQQQSLLPNPYSLNDIEKSYYFLETQSQTASVNNSLELNKYGMISSGAQTLGQVTEKRRTEMASMSDRNQPQQVQVNQIIKRMNTNKQLGQINPIATSRPRLPNEIILGKSYGSPTNNFRGIGVLENFIKSHPNHYKLWNNLDGAQQQQIQILQPPQHFAQLQRNRERILYQNYPMIQQQSQSNLIFTSQGITSNNQISEEVRKNETQSQPPPISINRNLIPNHNESTLQGQYNNSMLTNRQNFSPQRNSNQNNSLTPGNYHGYPQFYHHEYQQEKQLSQAASQQPHKNAPIAINVSIPPLIEEPSFINDSPKHHFINNSIYATVLQNSQQSVLQQQQHQQQFILSQTQPDFVYQAQHLVLAPPNNFNHNNNHLSQGYELLNSQPKYSNNQLLLNNNNRINRDSLILGGGVGNFPSNIATNGNIKLPSIRTTRKDNMSSVVQMPSVCTSTIIGGVKGAFLAQQQSKEMLDEHREVTAINLNDILKRKIEDKTHQATKKFSIRPKRA